MPVTTPSRFPTILCLAIMVIAAAAHAEVPKPGATEDKALSAPLHTAPLPGYCAFDPKAGDSVGLQTAFRQGVRDVTQLVAMYVPCAELERAKAGRTNWLPDWIAIETNPVTLPADDDRIAGTRGAVEMLCQDSQVLHRKIDAPAFAGKAEMAHKGLSPEKRVIYFGVVGEERGVCYLSSLRLETDGTGTEHRLLTVVGFMVAGDRWVHLSAQRETPDGSTADGVFALARQGVEEFLRLNP